MIFAENKEIIDLTTAKTLSLFRFIDCENRVKIIAAHFILTAKCADLLM